MFSSGFSNFDKVVVWVFRVGCLAFSFWCLWYLVICGGLILCQVVVYLEYGGFGVIGVLG